MIKILSTKTIPNDLIQQAKAANIFIEMASFIETKPIEEPSVAEKIKQYGSEHIIALFTSVNAVEAVFSQTAPNTDWRFFCIEGATQKALLAFVQAETIIATATNSAALAEEIILNKLVQKHVFFCGNKRMNAMPDKLLHNEVLLEEIVVYETVPSPKKISETYEGIMFFSPSAVESFFSINEIPQETAIFSVGKTTTKALRKLTNNNIITATFPSAESLLKEVRVFYLDKEGE